MDQGPSWLHHKSNVRFGSKADMCAAKRNVRFTPNSDRESGIPAKGHVRFTPKSGLCGAAMDVRYGPIADKGGGGLCRALMDDTRRASPESPFRHWHYLHHLHGSPRHGDMRIVSKEGCSCLMRFCLND